MTQLSRRGLFLGLSAVIAAPAIVRASNLMAIKPLRDMNLITHIDVKYGELWADPRWPTHFMGLFNPSDGTIDSRVVQIILERKNHAATV